jgi:hypothetical protein
VFPEVDQLQSYSFNFLVGDMIETSFGVSARFVGTQGGRVWFRPSDSRCVFSILNLRSVSCRSRPGHDIQTVMIDGSPAVLDRTPKLCEDFGRAIGDLIWFPRRGIVQFVGMFARRYVFLDFSDNSLFSSEPYNFLVVRAMSRMFAAPRKILTAEGELVALDVCAAKRIFLPGDRVIGSFGGGTFLGTDDRGKSFVQSDEMRVNEIEGAEVSIITLQLTRRIGVKATRKVALKGGQEVSVSLSARDRVEDLMADDIIQVGRDLFRVIGVVIETGKVYAQPLAGGQPQEIAVPGAAELIQGVS